MSGREGKRDLDPWRWLPILGGLVLLVSLAAYYLRTKELGADDFQRGGYYAESVRHLDQRLGRDVLVARQSDYHNYDAVVRTSQELTLAIESLGEALQPHFESNPGMAAPYRELVAEIAHKLDVLEEFKSANALLKNSLHYLPQSAELLLAAIPHDAPHRESVAEYLEALLRDVLVHTLTRDNAYLHEVAYSRIALWGAAQGAPEEIKALVLQLFKHVEIVMAQRARVTDYVAELLDEGVESLSEDLGAQHERLALAHHTGIENSRQVFLLLTAVLSVYLIHIIRRLHAQTASLRGAVNDLNYQKFALDQHAVVSVTDVDGNIRYVNDRFTELSGYAREELIGKTHGIVRSGAHSSEFYSQLWSTIKRGEVWKGEICNQRKDGGLFWVDATIVPFRDAAGTPSQYVAIHSDITSRRLAEEALFAEKEFAQTTLRSIADGIVTTDMDGYISYVNPVLEELSGRRQSDVLGKRLDGVIDLVDEDTGKQLTQSLLERCLEGQEIPDEGDVSPALINAWGQAAPVKVSASLLRDPQGIATGGVIVFHDMGRERHLRRRLAHQATHDELTQLANRRIFEERLADLINLAQRENTKSILLYLDLDQFKVVNDTCGHVAGDQLLKQVAKLLHEQLRESDLIARLGGDEFGALLPYTGLADGQRVAEKLIRVVQELRFHWNEQVFTIGVSIGMVPMDESTDNAAVAMSDADMACYAAKEKGRSRIQVFERGDQETRLRRGEMRWVSRLSRAIEESRFALFGQAIVPAVSAQGGDVCHFEVLVRMKDEDGALLTPGEFIPAAERYDLMPTIDRWVVATLFEKYAAYLGDNDGQCDRLRFSINLSGTSLNDSRMLQYILAQIEIHQVPPEDICFEVTETATIGNLKQAMDFMAQLKAKGCHFSLDDFGSGLSSFAYLKNLPVDNLKIDGAFVRDMGSNPVDRAMIEAVNRVGHTMGLKTIAEWVEDERTRAILVDIGIDYLQGYSIHRPEPLANILQRIRPATLRVVS